MKRLLSFFLMVIGTSSLQAQPACVSHEPGQLRELKNKVADYYTSGLYQQDLNCVVAQAYMYLKSKLPAKPNQALTFDIDDTVLSTWQYNKSNDFGYDKYWAQHWENQANFPVIKPMLNLYTFAKKQGYKVFFITGRKPNLTDATQLNLLKAGFKNWDGIFFKPNDYRESSLIPYKSGMRKALTEEGYSIILNMGDQESDLQGNYAEKSLKLPNPMYLIP